MTKPRAIVLLLVGSLAPTLLAGCSHPWNALPEGSYERGRAEAEGGSSLSAVEDLKLFIRRNPQDPNADDAQFLVGQTYMDTEDYPVAAVEFEIMQVDYPNSVLADDAAYLEALCYVKQVPDYRLDQTMTKKAMEKLKKYLSKYPTGKHVDQAQQELATLQAKLDHKHFDEAKFYKRRGRLKASSQVLKNILRESPDSQYLPDILMLQGEVEFKLENYGDAERALQQLLDRWPKNKMHERARHLLNRVQKESAGAAP